MWRVTRTGSPEVLRVSDSSPDSAETAFRELDDVFLQVFFNLNRFFSFAVSSII